MTTPADPRDPRWDTGKPNPEPETLATDRDSDRLATELFRRYGEVGRGLFRTRAHWVADAKAIRTIVHSEPAQLVVRPASRQYSADFGCLIALGFCALFWLLVWRVATPRSAPIPTTSPPVVDVRPGSAGPSIPATGASGWAPIGAPQPAKPTAGYTLGVVPDAAIGQVPGGAPQLAVASKVTGWASWYGANGDVASVPWWQPGQEPVWAAVSRVADGRTYAVTVLIVGFCQCYVGTPRERAIDLSDDAFRQLYDTRRPDPGVIRVTIELLGAGPGLPATDGER